MTQHMTAEARAIAEQASEHAIRLGHPYFGGEHFLLALAASGHPAGTVLREHGVTPGRVEAEVVRLAGGGLFGDLDRGALAAVGVDVEVVRTRVETSFAPGTLTRAARAVHREPAWFDPRPRSGAQRNGVFLPHGPGAGQALLGTVRRAQARDASGPADVEDLALGVLTVSEGLVPAILAALGTSGAALGSAILAADEGGGAGGPRRPG